MGSQNMLSNVIGAPFPEYVLTQLGIRAAHNSSKNRTDEEVLFLANKSAWVKLTSSVRVKLSNGNTAPSNKLSEYYQLLIDKQDQSSAAGYDDEDSLRKNWILEAGTSKGTSIQDSNDPTKSLGGGIDLRKGIGPDGAYGLGGIDELGYRPMPGLTSVEIDTLGALGSLRQATISFKVWNMNQLNVIEALYFRLGYSMVLEWGHTQYYRNVGAPGLGTFTTGNNIYGLDLFRKNNPLRKEEIQQLIAQKSAQSSGNYQGMLGIVTNFTWSLNQEGGYDCNIKLLGLGSIIDSMRVNLSYKMPAALNETFVKYKAELKAELDRKIAANKLKNKNKADAQAAADYEASRTSQGLAPRMAPVVTDANGIKPVVAQDNPAIPNVLLSSISYVRSPGGNGSVDYYYKAYVGGNNTEQPKKDALINELNSKRTGLFLTPAHGRAFQVIPANFNGVQVTLNAAYLQTYGKIRKAYQDGVQYTPNWKFPNFFVGNYEVPIQKGAHLIFVGLDDPRQINLHRAFTTELFKANTGFTNWKQQLDEPVLYGFWTLWLYVIDNKQKFFALYYGGGNSSSQQVQEAFDNFFYNPKITLDAIDKRTPPKGPNANDYDWGPQLGYSGTGTGTSNSGVQVPFTFVSNDTGLIQDVSFTQPAEVIPTAPADAEGTGLEDIPQAELNSLDSSQVESGLMFQSSLHVMLTFVKTQLLYAGRKANVGDVISDSILKATNLFYNDGIFQGITSYTPPTNLTTANGTGRFALKEYIAKGFNSNLLLGVPSTTGDALGASTDAAAIKAFYDSIPSVDWTSLCTGYVINYQMKPNGVIPPEYPTYIKLGYLLAFLNNMCLIYDSTVDTDKHPYVYIDFNPETNFCLTNPSQLSVDPFTCLIPFDGTPTAYLNIFPEGIRGFLKDKFSGDLLLSGPDVGAVTQDRLSAKIKGFKNPNNAYQGKTMEILVNINFLLDTLNKNITSDKEHAINLKAFLDAIVTGINKSLGNINLFRVSYRDDSNTVIIKDDQYVPSNVKGTGGTAVEEGWTLQSDNLNKNLKEGIKYSAASPAVARYGMLPVFGTKSIVRDMQFQTNMSTAISSQIAISAQAQTGSVNSTDNSLFSYLNATSVNYEDAYKPKITNIDSPKADASTSKKGLIDSDKVLVNDISQAEQFNTHVKSVYSLDSNLSSDKVSMAVNYFLDGMSNLKAKDTKTSAAPFIPANLEITMDGIGGIVMGNAFTIPEERLPNSLRSTESGKTKVGFIVVGLTHTLGNNQWLTKIRGQMIKLRDDISSVTTPNYKSAAPRYIIPASNGNGKASYRASSVYRGFENRSMENSLKSKGIQEFIKALDIALPNIGKGIKALMVAQALSEGYGNLASKGYKFGNPGNAIVIPAGTNKDLNGNPTDYGFQVFAKDSNNLPIEGTKAMFNKVIKGALANTSNNYTSKFTLFQYIATYAPEYDDNGNRTINDPTNYTNEVLWVLKNKYGISSVTAQTTLEELNAIQ